MFQRSNSKLMRPCISSGNCFARSSQPLLSVQARLLSSTREHNLVSPASISKLQQSGRPIVFLDTTWYLGGPPKGVPSAIDGWAAKRIPGSYFFDIDAIGDPTSNLPHTVPRDRSQFQSLLEEHLGLHENHLLFEPETLICAYTQPHSMFTGPRCWWMFKNFGFENVTVLDGGLLAWEQEGLSIDSNPPPTNVQRTPQSASRDDGSQQTSTLLYKLDQILENISSGQLQVVDARSKGRFLGTEPEPRKGVAGGHVPGSKSLFFGDLLSVDQYGGSTLKSNDEIINIAKQAGVDLSAHGKPIVTTCGSGVTACVVTFALHIATGMPLEHIGGVFDGSWTEYGSDPSTPKAVGIE